MGALELAIGAWLLFGRKSTTQKIREIEQGLPVVPAPPSTPTRTTPIASTPPTKTAAALKAATETDLLRRANQPRAKRWSADFQALGAPPQVAAAYARWAGIESGGNPLAVSPIGERGLFQITKTTAAKTVTPAEWEAMVRPTTTRPAHALMALAQAKTYGDRAKRMTKNWPTDPIDQVWYQKAWHARPGDFRSGKMHGPARQMAQQLEREYQGDAKALRRLHAANVIAFGTLTVGPG